MFLKKIFRHIWPIAMTYKWSFFASFAFFGLAMFFDYTLKALYLKRIIDLVSSASYTDDTLSAPLMHLVWMTALTLTLGFIFSRLGNWMYRYCGVRTFQEFYNYAFKKITMHSYSFFGNHFTGGLVTKSKRFTQGFRNIYHIVLTTFWPTLIIILGSFIILFQEVPNFALILLAWIVVYVFIMYKLVKIQFPHSIRRAKADSKVGGRLSDVFTNIFALKVFSARENEILSFAEVTKEEAFYRNKSWFVINRQRTVKAALMISFQIFVLYLSVTMWLSGEISTGTIVLIQTYVLSILARLWEIDEGLSGFMENVSEMSEAIDIFETKPDILDTKNPEKVEMENGEIEFKNVCFSYNGGGDVFHDFSLKIKSGERVGLVGHSGAGKSTITKIILRFLDVKSGAVEIDGQNIANVLQDDLRRKIAYVPQEPILFHRSIRENIAYGKIDATDEEIISAAKRAHAHEFIEKLQYGYDTMVGERGVKLSGGERQRVSIARVMLTSAPILILDEATSSLDSVSEHYIQEAFEELMKNRTTLVIAHRLSTIQKMDRIIVLDGGRIVEEGSHKELLEKNGVYKELWSHQTGFLEQE